ncbi:MAG: septum formation protein Maf [Desulfovibrio sp.]|nr:septum formation protein Maf [Desulfovibrio sp.]
MAASIFSTSPGCKICLASASSRRQELLAATGVDFFVLKTGCPEARAPAGAHPDAYALATAAAKASAAMAIFAQTPTLQTAPTAIITCDTIVSLDNAIFGKPESETGLLTMLRLLNGRRHQVFSGVCIVWPDGAKTQFVEATAVHFADWPEACLLAYAAACRPYDKAGGYGIQDGGGFLADKIEGAWTNVVGLPLARLLQELLQAGMIVAGRPPASTSSA